MKWSEKSEYQQPPAGTHIARCIAVVDLGTQTSEFNGKVRQSRKVRLTFELSECLMDDGRPFTISRSYTATLHPKSALRHDLECWRGKKLTKEEASAFEPAKLLGVPAQLTLVENGDFVNIASIAPVPKKLAVPKQHNPSVLLSLEPDEYDHKVFLGLTDKVRDKIMQSPEWKRLQEMDVPVSDDSEPEPVPVDEPF